MARIDPRILGKAAIAFGTEVPRRGLRDAIGKANTRLYQNTLADTAGWDIRAHGHDLPTYIRALDAWKFQRLA